MIGFEYIIAPTIGGIIGYITNDIAIRMLFRPHTAKYICGVHVPFTPGIIPKEKGRIAEAIGEVVSENLMNKDVLVRYLLSDDMVMKVRTFIESFINVQKQNEESFTRFLMHYFSDQEIRTISNNINKTLTSQIHNKLASPMVGEKIAHITMEQVAQKLNGYGARELLTGAVIGGIGGVADALFGRNIIGKFLGMLREPAERYLATNINDMLQQNGATIVSNIVDGEVESFLNTPIKQLLADKDGQLTLLANTIENVYRTFITEHLPKILESIDISKIVRGRINEMDVNETEKLIFQVMDKELKAIVWLGALLGLIMGCINVLVL